jgi:DNA-binding transcriptional LysR family regulator
MTLLQLRFLREIARQSLSMSAAARMLNTSQPSVSRQIQQLEAELGVELLTRQRNRITG